MSEDDWKTSIITSISALVSSMDAFKSGIGARMEKSEKAIAVLETYMKILTWATGLIVITSVGVVVSAFWKVILK